MRKNKKAVSLLLAASLILASFTSGETAQAAKDKKQKVRISSVKITNTGKKLRMQKGKKFRLKTTVSAKPNKKKYKKLKFTSSNKKAVLVNQRGLLKAKKKGTAKITVASKSNSKKKATVTVSVTTDILVNTIRLNKTKITVGEFNEEDIQLEAKKILPANAKNKEIEWSTSDESVADVDEDGLVTTGDAGIATITATAADKGGASATCKVTVIESEDGEDDDTKETTPPDGDNTTAAPVDSAEPVVPTAPVPTAPAPTAPVTEVKALGLSAVTDWLMPGDSTLVKVTYDPVDTTQTAIDWTFSEEEVSISQDGKLTIGEKFAFDAGESQKLVTVTATSRENPSVSKSITVKVFNPDRVTAPVLENPSLDLGEEMVTDWSLCGEYGTVDFNEDGTVNFSSEREDGKPGSVYNNGCAWYLDSRKSRTDVSGYSYVMLTFDTRFRGNIKLMTWSGTDYSEWFWEKKDYWMGEAFAEILNNDGSTSLIYRTDFVFQNVKNAKSIGVTVKSGDTDDAGIENFQAEQACIKGIEFINSLPEGSEILNPGTINPSSKPFENPDISLTNENAASWTKADLFGTTTYDAGGTAKFFIAEDNKESGNNGCAWHFAEDGERVDVSAYKYLFVHLKADVPVELLTWCANSHPDGRYEGKRVATPYRAYTYEDGSQVLVYRVSTAFGNPKQARAAGIYLSLYGPAEEGSADIYEMSFTNELPEPPIITGPPVTEPPATGPVVYYFTDIHQPPQEDNAYERPAVAVLDEDGTPCTEIKYTRNNQYTFFELPEAIHLSDYESVSITANIPGSIVFRGLSGALDPFEEAWYDTYCVCEDYLFSYGSYTDRSESWKPGYSRGIETQSYQFGESMIEDEEIKYFSLHTNSSPKGGFGYENYLIYSIELTPKTPDAPKIILKSTDKDTVEQSPAKPGPSVEDGEVFVPTGDVYEIELSETNETEATKDKEEYRTDVTFHEDGSVSYTNTQKSNSGMVFRASPDGKKVDLSGFDYIEVTLDGPAWASLRAFNDASSWWNKVERNSASEGGHDTIRFSISELERYNLETRWVDGFAIGFTSDECVGEPVRIYSIRAVKEG